MERSYTDLGWLKDWTTIKVEIAEPGFQTKVIIPPATTLYDCQLCWLDDDDGAMIDRKSVV